jgi:small-conductance mechanosensitive channel
MTAAGILQKEWKRRGVFALKVAALVGLIFLKRKKENIIFEWDIPGSILDGLIFFLAASLIISLGRFIMVAVFLRRQTKQESHRNNFILGINSIASFLTNFMFILALMVGAGVNVPEFFTSITIVAAAIAILSKDYINSMINGLIMMFGDQLSLGDYIKVGEQSGKIVDINFLNIVVETEQGKTILVPNGAIITSQIQNLGREQAQEWSVFFELPLGQILSESALESFIASRHNELSVLTKMQDLTVKVAEIKKDAVLYELSYRSLPEIKTEAAAALKKCVVEFIHG